MANKKVIKIAVIALALASLIAPSPAMAGVICTVTAALTISDVSATNVTRTSATISWKTDGNATSQVFYDTEFHADIADYAYWTDEDTTLVKEHSLDLTGLSSATTYHYRVKSVLIIDSTESIAISEDYTFTTLSGCFIATAAYGTPAAEQIDILREFRDEVMLPSKVGAAFVSFYYKNSPPIATFISQHEVLRTIVREAFIKPLVAIVRFSHSLWGLRDKEVDCGN